MKLNTQKKTMLWHGRLILDKIDYNLLIFKLQVLYVRDKGKIKKEIKIKW